jgi:hypothetical protein
LLLWSVFFSTLYSYVLGLPLRAARDDGAPGGIISMSLTLCKSNSVISIASNLFSDASHSGHTPFCPGFEVFTVGLRTDDVRPIFRYSTILISYVIRGPASNLSHQSRQTTVFVHSVKRGKYQWPPRSGQVSTIYSFPFVLGA